MEEEHQRVAKRTAVVAVVIAQTAEVVVARVVVAWVVSAVVAVLTVIV